MRKRHKWKQSVCAMYALHAICVDMCTCMLALVCLLCLLREFHIRIDSFGCAEHMTSVASRVVYSRTLCKYSWNKFFMLVAFLGLGEIGYFLYERQHFFWSSFVLSLSNVLPLHWQRLGRTSESATCCCCDVSVQCVQCVHIALALHCQCNWLVIGSWESNRRKSLASHGIALNWPRPRARNYCQMLHCTTSYM